MLKASKIIRAALMYLVVAVVSAMVFTVGEDTYKESDGKAVNVDLTATVAAKQVALVDGWLGITGQSGDSGDTITLDIEDDERQFTVPSGLSVSRGDIVYIEVAEVTGHTINDAGYSTSAGSGKTPFFKATEDKDGNDTVMGIRFRFMEVAS